MNYEQWITYFNQNDTFSVQNGIRLERLEAGHAHASMPFCAAQCNFMGTMHGGALATLADITAGSALYVHQRRCVTLNTSIQYLKPIKSGVAHAIAREISSGKRVAVCLVEIFDDTNVLCCTATVTMYLTDQPFLDVSMNGTQ